MSSLVHVKVFPSMSLVQTGSSPSLCTGNSCVIFPSVPQFSVPQFSVRPSVFPSLSFPSLSFPSLSFPSVPQFSAASGASRVLTSDSKHSLPIAPNALDRKFSVGAPNQVWVGDLTYIPTAEGWLFLAVVIDLFSRKVVGWSMRPDMQRELVLDALDMAWLARNPGRQTGLVFHSDRGSQYASDDFSRLVKRHGIVPSMSRKGNCWDNACSETLFASLKVERLHGRQFQTIREAKDETIAWLLWYNRTRMHSTLDYVSPMQFEQDWTEATTKSAA